MFRKYIWSVALVMLLSGLSFGSIEQIQGFSIGLTNDLLLAGPLGTAGNLNLLTINLGQSMLSGLGSAPRITLAAPTSGIVLPAGAGIQVQGTAPGAIIQTQGFGASAAQNITGFVAGMAQTQ